MRPGFPLLRTWIRTAAVFQVRAHLVAVQGTLVSGPNEPRRPWENEAGHGTWWFRVRSATRRRSTGWRVSTAAAPFLPAPGREASSQQWSLVLLKEVKADSEFGDFILIEVIKVLRIWQQMQ